MKTQRLPASISEALAAGATLLVPNSQRQAAVKAAWSEAQRDAGRKIWATPRVLTFDQFAESTLAESWAARSEPDRLLPIGAEWAALRTRRESGGSGEARALLTAIRTLGDWGIGDFARARHASPEAELLHTALTAIDTLAMAESRKPLRAWLGELPPTDERLCVAGEADLPAAPRAALRTLGARTLEGKPTATTALATARDDEHEFELIADWCRSRLAQDPHCRLLVIDARLRQRRHLYDRLLSQTLTPSQWLAPTARATSSAFAIEGGQPLAEFPLVAHAVLTLRLLTGRLRFDELVHWFRQPFLDGSDLFAGAIAEEAVRTGRKLDYTADELATFLDREATATLATRLKRAREILGQEKLGPADWAPRILAALRALGWPGSRPLRSEEQQTLARWHALLDEYSALGLWLPRATPDAAVATLADLAAERNFDAASVAAPVTVTESHGDPIVRYDGIWVAGLDGAQWPPPPRPDVFIPLALQVAAGVPWASAAAQTRAAQSAFGAWRAATDELVCSWARLEGDAHRTPSPLLKRVAEFAEYVAAAATRPLADALYTPQLEVIEDARGLGVDTRVPVRGGTTPLTLQAECAFHAYGEMRLGAPARESPVPGIDPRDRGKLLHKALELVWRKLETHFKLTMLDAPVLRATTIPQAVQAAVTAVFRGYVPHELQPALDREVLRLERLIERLLEVERARPAFEVDQLEQRRDVSIGGGQFEVRIDRIDHIEGGGFAILDYKSGNSKRLEWDPEKLREPQLLAYLMAERGRDVHALANVSLTRGRVKFAGKSSRKGLLTPDVPGLNPAKVPADEIELAWRSDTDRWLHALQSLAAAYLAGDAPVQPANDVCRHCHLTVLCRRVELQAAAVHGERVGDE